MILASKTCETTRTLFSKFVVINLGLPLAVMALSIRANRLPQMTQPRPTGCEYNTAILDGLAQKTDLDKLIIVIAHLGPKDSKPNLNNRRLHNVRTYLTEFLTEPSVRRTPETVVLAQGERANDVGRVDFYVDGKLVQSLKVHPSADLLVANCGREPPESPCPPSMRSFFPCKDKYSK